MNFGLKNKNVIVTASSKGIGKAVAKVFLEESANVAICSSNIENLIEAGKELQSYSENLIWKECDLNDENSIGDFLAFVKEKFGTVDVLVNNCGGPAPGTFETLSDEDWINGYKQVLRSATLFTKGVLPGMKEKGWGRIINITSISVKQPIENLMLSNTFRAGLTGFAKTLSREIGQFGITVNNVAPGYTMTGRLRELAEIRAEKQGKTVEEIFAEMGKTAPLNRIGKPEEIANVVVFLASEKAAYVTGTTIQVDGGETKSLL